MNISSISFGRAIEVKAPDVVVDKLIESANKTILRYDKRTAFDDFAQKIFCDAKQDEKKAVRHVSPSGDVYIFSGKEASTKLVIEGDRDKKLNCNNNYLAHLTNPDTYKKMSVYINKINDSIIKEADDCFEYLIESGKNKTRCSQIELVEDLKGKRIVYTSSTDDAYEEMILELED